MDNLYLATLCAVVPGLGRKRISRLVTALGSAKAVFEADAATLRGAGCPERAVAEFFANREPRLLERLEYFCRHAGVRLLSIYDAGYPESLRRIADPPLVLYVKGELPQTPYALAVVGSRTCTQYGREATAFFTKALVREGVPIISGGARGIDAAAHQACLEVGGHTVAVLGCGLDQYYPPENERLLARIAERGAVISEYPPGVGPLGRNFPARNRIIVGLAQAVLVIEARLPSGALITANIAADEGRDVYCVPGNIFDHNSLGCHELIRTGAKLVDEPGHILEDRRSWQEAQQRTPCQPDIFSYTEEVPAPPVINTSALGERLLAILQAGTQTLESLTEQSGATLAEVSLELLELQVAGLVAMDQAQRYYRR